MKKVILPNNGWGVAIMLAALSLLAIIPFVLTLWLSLKVAPWWVATPLASAASLLTLLLTVKYRT